MTAEPTLSLIPLFAGLTPEELEPLQALTRRVAVKEGQVLFTQGDPGETLYLIETGRLKVYTLDTEGQEVVLDIMGPDDVIGELALLDGQPRSATVEALSECDLLAIDREPFLAHLMQHPETALRLMEYLTRNLRQRVFHAETLALSHSAARLAHVLLFLAERDGRVEPGLVTATLNQKDLAAAVGTSEEWVHNMLAEWCRDGIIGMTGSRRLILHDVEALRALRG
jgi:CRP/FNR family cyclic AMP-dependent transcriptional regulator